MVLTTAIAGGFTYGLIQLLTTWDDPFVFIAIVAVAALCDVLIAQSMEATAPSKVDIGPGEKGLAHHRPSETATVISGFDTSERGQVSIRGEIWQAVREPDDSSNLPEGTAVQIVERQGLTLIVSSIHGSRHRGNQHSGE